MKHFLIPVYLLLVLFFCSGCPRPVSINDVYTPQAQLPRDEAVHFKNSLEWWYFTGHLQDTLTSREYGLEYVFFHFNPRNKSDYLMANFAISDPQDSLFVYDYKVVKSDSLLTSNLPLNLQIPYQGNTWSLQGTLAEYHLSADMSKHPGYSMEITTTPGSRVWMHGGGRGFQEYGKYAEAGYYSFPKLKVKGALEIKGHKLGVKGLLWYDRQWNCIGVYQRKVAWDWMSIQLQNNGGELMLFKLYHRADEAIIYGGSYLDPQGKNVMLGSDEIEILELEHWRSPRSGISYPIVWRVKLPNLEMDLTVRARFPEQELSLKFTAWYQLHYWEGMCLVEGTRGGIPVRGKSYVEMTNRKKRPQK